MKTALPQLRSIEHHTADLPDFRVNYAEAGDPDGNPVLLLHGWPQHHGMWGRVIELLDGHGLRLIAPDLRGFGWSEAPGRGNDADTYARDQIALLDALGIERADFIGHDWGGWTGMLLGLDHAERIRRMVICNVLHPFVRPRPELLLESWRLWYVAANAAPLLGPRAVPHTARTILTRGNVGTPFTKEEVDGYVERFREPGRARAAVELYRYYGRAFREALRGTFESKRLTPPTLLLFGVKDRYVTVKSVNRPSEYEGRADDLRVELVPDSGHFIVSEKPELVAERALAHFAKTTEGSAVGPA